MEERSSLTSPILLILTFLPNLSVGVDGTATPFVSIVVVIVLCLFWNIFLKIFFVESTF